MSLQSPLPTQRRPATIKDVARELDISVATVSRALSKPHLLRPATVERVREAVARLGYRPNLVAQNLKLGQTNIIYVIIPSLSPFFFEIFRGIERAALELGYSAIIAHSGRDPVREGEYFDQVACGRADGVLLLSSARFETRPQHRHQLPPAVAVLEADEGGEFPAVRVDHVAAAMQATNHLIQLGHRRIAHITGNARAPMAVHRRAGFLTSMEAAGFKSAEEHCVPGEFTPEAGQSAMEILLARPVRPTAVFAANDEIAIGAIRAIHAAGLKVPEDISVIGYDDQRLGRIYDPPLTTVHIPTFDLGYQAMVKLRRILAREDYEHDVLLPTHVVKRGTTAAPKKE
jgi:LacI family repressor for deo operon, udp, cdd, tsx, nupC, and nupG